MSDRRVVFLDCEFDPRDSTLAGLLSLGVTDDAGRDYYAVHAGANLSGLLDHTFILANVLPHLPVILHRDGRGAVTAIEWDPAHPHYRYIRSAAQIAADLERYFDAPTAPKAVAYFGAQDMCRLHSLFNNDWESMPRCIPTYFTDLKVMAEDLGAAGELPAQDGTAHHALDDAKWNRHAYRFLRSLQTSGRLEDVARKLCEIEHPGRGGVEWHRNTSRQGTYRRAAQLLLDAYDIRPR